MLSIIICVFFILFFYGMFFFAFYLAGGWKILKRLNTVQLFITVLLMLVSLAFIISMVKRNNFVYYWDYGGYWTMSVRQSQLIFSKPFSAIKELFRSINYDDYNLILPTLISLPLKFIGYSYEKYITINTIMFFFPILVIVPTLCIKVIELIYKTKPIDFLLALICLIFFPASYYAMLKGYIDIAEIIPVSLLLSIFVDYDILEICSSKKQFQKNIVISFLLIFVLLFRRYFAYFVVGYVAILLFRAVWQIAESNDKKNAISNVIKNVFMIGFISLMILTIFFHTFLFHSIENNYKAQYVGYNLPIYIKLKNIVSSYGILSIVLVLAAGLVSKCHKRFGLMYLSLLILIIVPVALFLRVQSMDVHHRLIIFVQIFIIEFAALYYLYKMFQGGIRLLFPIILTILYMSNFIICFYGVPNKYEYLVRYFQIQRYEALIRNDIPELSLLKNHLNDLTNGNNKKVYILASGSVLNGDIMKSLDKPQNFAAVNNQLDTADVDLRDGFPSSFLKADIIVTTDPIQLHLAEGTQEVIRFLANAVMDSTSPIGKHFIKENVYNLDGNVKAIIYLKKSQYENSDITYLRDYYNSYYPQYPSLFKIG